MEDVSDQRALNGGSSVSQRYCGQMMFGFLFGSQHRWSEVVSIDGETASSMLLACHGEFVQLRAGWCITC
jgi:hypothetical protein